MKNSYQESETTTMSKKKDNSTPLAADVRDLAIVAAILQRWGYTSDQAIREARCLLARSYNTLARELKPKGQRSVFGK